MKFIRHSKHKDKRASSQQHTKEKDDHSKVVYQEFGKKEGESEFHRVENDGAEEP